MEMRLESRTSPRDPGRPLPFLRTISKGVARVSPLATFQLKVFGVFGVFILVPYLVVVVLKGYF